VPPLDIEAQCLLEIYWDEEYDRGMILLEMGSGLEYEQEG
jgi:hypothetical protein